MCTAAMQFLHKVFIATSAWLVLPELFLAPPSAEAFPVDAVTIGGSEKGVYLGIDQAIGRKDLLEIGALGISGTVANVDVGLSEPLPINVDGIGMRLAYSRFLFGGVKSSGPFVQAGVSLVRLSASSRLDLGKLVYTSSGVDVTCSSCGIATIQTVSRSIDVIPSASIGWQFMLGKRASLRILAGVQYYSVPSADWSAEDALPKFAKNEISSAVSELNSDIDASSDFYPSASISMSYFF